MTEQKNGIWARNLSLIESKSIISKQNSGKEALSDPVIIAYSPYGKIFPKTESIGDEHMKRCSENGAAIRGLDACTGAGSIGITACIMQGSTTGPEMRTTITQGAY
jgi:hypothetical protein